MHALRLSLVALALFAAPAPASPLCDAHGDPLPPGAIARLGTARLRHGGAVWSLTFAPDGKTLASGGTDDAVRLWDPVTGRPLRHFTGEKWIGALAYSPDGKILASASGANGPYFIALRDVASGKVLRRLEGHTSTIRCLVFSPDGKTLASACWDRSIRLWDAASGRELRVIDSHPDGSNCVAFTADGKTLIAAGRDFITGAGREHNRDHTIHLWDVETGKQLARLAGHTEDVEGVALSPGGKLLASVSLGGQGSLRLWDMKTRKLVWAVPAGGRFLAFSPKGDLIAVGGGSHAITLLRADDGREVRRIDAGFYPHALAFAPDGNTLAAGLGGSSVGLWDVRTGRARHEFSGHTADVKAVAFSPDGATVGSCGYDGTLRLWDVKKLSERQRIALPGSMISRLAFDPLGKQVVLGTNGGLVEFRDTASGERLWQAEGAGSSWVQALAFAPDGSAMAWGWQGGALQVFDRQSKPRRLAAIEGNGVWAMAFAPDGNTLATAGGDKTVRLWDLVGKKGMPGLLERRPFVVRALAAAPVWGVRDDKLTWLLAVAGDNGALELWDAAAGKLLGGLVGHEGNVYAVAFSRDGRTLASVGEDRTVRLWEVASQRERARFVGHGGEVLGVAISPDGRTVASAGRDTSVLLWDATGLRSKQQRGRKNESGTPCSRPLQACLSLVKSPCHMTDGSSNQPPEELPLHSVLGSR